MRNANDVSREIAAGVMDGLGIGERRGGARRTTRRCKREPVTVMLDSEQIVTPRFAEKVRRSNVN